MAVSATQFSVTCYHIFVIVFILSVESAPLCTNLNDCLPLYLKNTSTSYVQCATDGLCHCSSCFLLNSTINQCYTLPNCTLYHNNTCFDIRRSQLIAIIYAVVLTIGGAANFYIERIDLAIPQLILGAIFTLFPFVGICVKRILDEFDYTYDRTKRAVWIIKGVAYLLVTMTLFAWYIADIVTFAINTRLDGRGCPLKI